MLQSAYFVAKIGADRAENEQHFAEIEKAGFVRNRLELLLEVREERLQPRLLVPQESLITISKWSE